MPKKSEVNSLIYKNANTYRIHTDNLRWTLLAGFAAFLTGFFSILDLNEIEIGILDFKISILLFIISFGYLFILAVQNWFYNLYARFVDECEERLVKGDNLRTLQQFAKEIGPEITPYHPAFFIAIVIVGSTALFFLYLAIADLYIPKISTFINSLNNNLVIVVSLFLVAVYFAVLHLVFKHWNKFIYKPIIVRFSNIYKPIISEKESVPHQD